MLLATEASQLHRLQQLCHAVDDPVPVLLDMHPHARQLTQLANRLGGNKAAPQQTVLQVLRNPARIDTIRLMSLQRSHGRWVHQH